MISFSVKLYILPQIGSKIENNHVLESWTFRFNSFKLKLWQIILKGHVLRRLTNGKKYKYIKPILTIFSPTNYSLIATEKDQE